jgi:hypothetical protein
MKITETEKFLSSYFDKAQACVEELRRKLKNVEIHVAQNKYRIEVERYFLASQTFNTRLQQNPLIILYCKSAKHVATAYKIAIKHGIPVRVRAGGHDHEGESSGTNVVLIDVSKMKKIEVDAKGIAKIGAGNRFIRLTKKLAKQKVMIAHGTCATVCVTGFTLGGGWGPWTRKMGMNCEHLKGATLMLGDGSMVEVDEDEKGNVPDLLWALRGGGGMSYGIVTELRLQTFALPEELIKFELHWNAYDVKEETITETYPTVQVLQAWEKVIQATDTAQVIGTNLKINARPTVECFDYETVCHNCCMYGYWEGEKAALRAFVKERFKAVPPTLVIEGEGGTDPQKHDESGGLMGNIEREGGTDPQKHYESGALMGNWGRVSFAKIKEKLGGKPIPPDLDEPAPHKITSRLVNKEGLGAEGYKQLLLSLTSPLVFKENRPMGLFTYVTLGAIVGDYYRNNADSAKSAFPYKDKLYTIQYQTWWNTDDKHREQYQDSPVYANINRAMDWIDAVRNHLIPNTSGAFISFKDNGVPTSVYFDKSYDRLKEIKRLYVKDLENHLRTRKTII